MQIRKNEGKATYVPSGSARSWINCTLAKLTVKDIMTEKVIIITTTTIKTITTTSLVTL